MAYSRRIGWHDLQGPERLNQIISSSVYHTSPVGITYAGQGGFKWTPTPAKSTTENDTQGSQIFAIEITIVNDTCDIIHIPPSVLAIYMAPLGLCAIPRAVFSARWRHQMKTSSVLLAICAGNSPVAGEFPAQRTVTRNFDVFCDLRLNKRLSKQSWGWWFETLSRLLWRYCNVSTITCDLVLISPKLFAVLFADDYNFVCTGKYIYDLNNIVIWLI